MTQRKRHSADFRDKVKIETFKGQRTANEIATSMGSTQSGCPSGRSKC